MYTNRVLATSGIVLVLLAAGIVAAIRVFETPPGRHAMGLTSVGRSR